MPNDLENTIRTGLLEDWDSLVEFQSAWEGLVARIPSASIFQTFQWHSCWWRAFGHTHKLFVIVCHRGQQLVSIAPMMITGPARPTSDRCADIRFIGCTNNASDYLDFIIDPDVPEALDVILNEIIGHLPKVRRIYLSHFPTHFENQSRVLSYLQARGVRLTVELEQEAPCRLMGDTQEDRRAVNTQSLRRCYNYFRKSGDLRFYNYTGEFEALKQMDEFFGQHVARRKLANSPSQFLDPAQRSFYRDLVGELLPHDWLRFDAILFNGHPIAFHFGFEYRNNFIFYKPTFDVKYSKKSPGQVLIKLLMEDAIEKGLGEFDFTVGSEPYKYRFSNEVRYNNRLIVFRSFIDYWAYRLKIALKKVYNYLR